MFRLLLQLDASGPSPPELTGGKVRILSFQRRNSRRKSSSSGFVAKFGATRTATKILGSMPCLQPLASPRFASSHIASLSLASPHLASPHIVSPRLADRSAVLFTYDFCIINPPSLRKTLAPSTILRRPRVPRSIATCPPPRHFPCRDRHSRRHRYATGLTRTRPHAIAAGFQLWTPSGSATRKVSPLELKQPALGFLPRSRRPRWLCTMHTALGPYEQCLKDRVVSRP